MLHALCAAAAAFITSSSPPVIDDHCYPQRTFYEFFPFLIDHRIVCVVRLPVVVVGWW
jgi:hypothetical protein